MKNKFLILALALSVSICSFAGCNKKEESSSESLNSISSAEDKASSENEKVASADEMVTPDDVVEDGMTPVEAINIKDGEYDVVVDSSSSMFDIISCKLNVSGGEMTAVMTMSGTGYLYVYMGTGEKAATADKSEYISFVENENGEHTFTVPVEALDKGINCASFSKRKEKWYDRTILFRADSLPSDAFGEGVINNAASLNLEDGEYTADVTLSGGSGKASVESPAKITVSGGEITAEIIWSSSSYDYMIIDGEKYLPVNEEGENSAFEIPVSGFDFNIPIKADTTAMSTPHEIEYTLNFSSDSIEKE